MMFNELINEVQVGYFTSYEFNGLAFESLEEAEGYILDQMYADYISRGGNK